MKDLERNYDEAKGRLGVFLVIALLIVLVAVIALISIIVPALICGIIGYFCWNYAVVEMFNFNQISLVNACILTITIGLIFSSYRESWENSYDQLEEVKSKVVRGLIVTAYILAMFALTSYLVMISWNGILPSLLKVDLTQINYFQAFLFTFLLNYLFGNINRNKNWLKDKKNKAKLEKEQKGMQKDEEIFVDEE